MIVFFFLYRKVDPWMNLLEKILQLGTLHDTEEMKIIEKIISKRNPSIEVRIFFPQNEFFT